jgi:hypothetical protein
MNRSTRTRVFTAALLLAAPLLRAQPPVEPSGHWEGTIEMQGAQMGFEVDLARDTKGELAGTIGIPSQRLKGVPLLKVAASGKAVTFFARIDQTMTGNLSDDGASMSGSFAVEGTTLPFTMTRKGDARIIPLPASPPIGKELEGTWTAQTASGNRVELRLANQPDGTSTGRLVNVSQGGLQIPVSVTQKASDVTFTATVLPGSFAGSLSADGAELVGKWTEGPTSVPLTLKRAGK